MGREWERKGLKLVIEISGTLPKKNRMKLVIGGVDFQELKPRDRIGVSDRCNGMGPR